LFPGAVLRYLLISRNVPQSIEQRADLAALTCVDCPNGNKSDPESAARC
jgi:hypothetical protein